MHSADAAADSPSGEVGVRVETHRGAQGGVQVLSICGDLDWQGVQELRSLLPPDLAAVLSPQGGPGGTWHAGSSTGSGPAPDAGTSGSSAPALPRLVVLDLAGVAFMDSSGVGTLVTLHRRLERQGRAVALCCLQAQPRHVVEMTAVDRVLAVHTHLGQALGASARAGSGGVKTSPTEEPPSSSSSAGHDADAVCSSPSSTRSTS